jgi:cellulose synthase/poly-beta-1,6-N-acetylglucosamine synthase-like glycosyltransferase
LPAWNAAATIAAALASLIRQTEPSWRCLVLDDGSDDATAAIAGEAARRDPRISVARAPHRGIVATLQDGLARCTGEFVARMDADDLMRRRRLQRQLAALDASPSLAGVGTHVRIVPRHGLTPRHRAYEQWLTAMRGPGDVRRDRFVECPVAHPTLMLRRAALARLGYRDAGWPEDYDLVLRALAAGLEIGVVPERLHIWRDTPRRLSRTDPRYAMERFVACKAHHLAATFLAEATTYVLWGYGGTGRALRRALAAHGRHPSHIVEIKPSRLGQRIHGAPVIGPAALSGLRGAPLVVSVAREGPRFEIRAALAAMGFVEDRDFVCAA